MGGKVGYRAGQYSSKIITFKTQNRQTSTVGQEIEKTQVPILPLSKAIVSKIKLKQALPSFLDFEALPQSDHLEQGEVFEVEKHLKITRE